MAKNKLPVTMKGYGDHAELKDYRVFVNPSITEVLCTTVAEALAMGKWVVCPKHPSNDFFAGFASCLQYEDEDEFGAAVHWALHHEPPPLAPEDLRSLSWGAAMERLVESAELDMHGLSMTQGTVKDLKKSRKKARSTFDHAIEKFYYRLGQGEGGGGNNTTQPPLNSTQPPLNSTRPHSTSIHPPR